MPPLALSFFYLISILSPLRFVLHPWPCLKLLRTTFFSDNMTCPFYWSFSQYIFLFSLVFSLFLFFVVFFFDLQNIRGSIFLLFGKWCTGHFLLQYFENIFSLRHYCFWTHSWTILPSCRKSCGRWGSSPSTRRRSRRSLTALRKSTFPLTPSTWCSMNWRSDTVYMKVLLTEWAPLTCKMMTTDLLPLVPTPTVWIKSSRKSTAFLWYHDKGNIAFLMCVCGFLCFGPHLTGRVKALSHLSCSVLHLCWSACMPLTPGLMDCLHSTEEGCEISLDLSWYCYNIWNETLSQEESNYLSSFGPWVCNISFPLQYLFAVYEISSSFWTIRLMIWQRVFKFFLFFEWKKIYCCLLHLNLHNLFEMTIDMIFD